jgi:septum formation inhibitor MinC
MNNLGRFNSDFKRSLSDAQKTIKKLQKSKIDTADLDDLLSQIKTQGEEIVALLKVKPLDNEAIVSALDELQNVRQEFNDQVAELTGDDNTPMPWDQGTQQFQKIEMSPSMSQYLPKKTEPIEESNPQPSPAPISESNPQPSPAPISESNPQPSPMPTQ